MNLELNWGRLMTKNTSISLYLFFCVVVGTPLNAKEKIEAYFSNDSVNGLIISDAYETHNMGLIYVTENYYFKVDLGIVSPDMHVYSNEYREANRSFGELISVEIGEPNISNNDFRFYTRIKGTAEFGLDDLQDFAHRILSLQPVNKLNNLIRMPPDLWLGVGLRREFTPTVLDLENLTFNLDGYVGSDTTFLNARFTKKIHHSALTYDFSLGGHLVAYDQIVSAAPINAIERKFIPEVSFGISYDAGPYSIFLRDVFSLPSIESDSDFYGVLNVGASYSF